jgi:hypothetical protein
MENLARYIMRASFSQERMKYLDQEGTVVYTGKDRKTNKVFPAMEWPAAMCTHISNRGEQMVGYYGNYSNVVDPLVCPKCQGTMRIISFIEDAQVIRDILKHLGIWLVRSRPPPKIHDPPNREYAAADLQIQPLNEILSTATRNTPGMNTFSHNAFLKNKA